MGVAVGVSFYATLALTIANNSMRRSTLCKCFTVFVAVAFGFACAVAVAVAATARVAMRNCKL